ncbi:MMPL family transporter [Photobacterium rosenbergii]|uniref:MMPL family transporter n=1 Tax=Photobacterium rosenbergii TaxID=294936 RepID=UPI001C9960D5|nr:MMPL family transporter [Photobacterium rosenbergii]
MLGAIGSLWAEVATRNQSVVETNLFALLPDSQQDPAVETAFEQVAGSLGEKVLFVVGGKDKPVLFEAAEQLINQLRNIGMFSDVTGQVTQSQQHQWAEFMFPRRANLLTSEQQIMLREQPQQAIDNVLAKVYNPFSGVTSRELEADPFLLFRDYLTELGQLSGNVSLENGFLTTAYNGDTYVLISADLAGSPYSLRLQQQLPELATLEANLRAQYDVDLLHTGVIFYAAHGTESAKGEISTIGLGSLVGVLTLLLVVYRSATPLMLAMLSIGCGLVFAFSLSIAVFGQVHIFSLVFGASLIGVSIDYAFHFLTERLAAGCDWNARQGLKHILAAISLGLCMSLIGYACMMVAPFPGLRQLSFFSAAGLAAAYATVVCWYPLLAAKPSRHVELPMRNGMTMWLACWNNRHVRTVLPAAMLLFAGIGLYQVQYDDDIRQLQALPSDLKQQEEQIKQITGLGNSQQMLLVKASNEQALLEQLEWVGRQLDPLVENGVIEGYTSIHQYIPSIKQQADNFQLIETLYHHQGQELVGRLNLGRSVELETEFTPITLDSFLQSSLANQLRFLWLGNIDGQETTAVLLKGIHDADGISLLADSSEGVTYLDKTQELSTIFADYRQRISLLLCIALGVIGALLSWRYGIAKGFRVMLPPVIACFVGIAITGYMGSTLNIFNLLGLFLILGIGIDYTLFFAEQSKTHSTLLAITLSAITTILSFGLLSLSETQAIHSFGITVLTGIFTAWLLAPLSLKHPNREPLGFTDEVKY